MPSFIRFGLILAALGAVVNLVGWATGTDVGMVASVWGLLAIVGSIIVLVQGVKAHRTQVAGADGDYAFGQAFVEALKIYGVSFVVGTIWNILYFSFINTDFTDRQKAAMTEFMEKAGTPEEAMSQALADLDKSPIELVLAPSTLGVVLVIGLIICAIIAAVLKRERKLA